MKKIDYQPAIDLIAKSSSVVVIQAENPDADSLGSSLALEGLLSKLGKEVHLYCPVGIPRHLRYLHGWERVTDELPQKVDLSIIVDTSAQSLVEKVFNDKNSARLNAAPCLIIDHHDNEADIAHPDLTVIQDNTSVATGQMIYDLAKLAGWRIDIDSGLQIAASILADSLGLTSKKTTSHSVRIIADLMEDPGIDMSQLDADRREWGKKSIEILRYKAELIKRIEFHLDNRLALVVIPQSEIAEYSDQYNPGALVLEELRMTEGVDLAVAIKLYDDKKITGRLRANYSMVCDKVAKHFGGGGHPFAAGFKTRDWDIEELRPELIKVAEEFLK